MRIQGKNRERGVALLFSILALMLLTAIGATLILMATTETSINSNYSQEQTAYFGAKAGLEEARARMMLNDPNSINAALPIAAPTTIGPGSPGVVYILNPGSGAASSVQPWDTASNSKKYPDDEICHDGYVGYINPLFTSAQVVAPQVRCDTTQLPSTALGPWYTSYTSALPFSGTSAALPFKWVRISPKLNGSVSYLTGTSSSSSTTVATYTTSSATGTTAATLICWDGVEETPLVTTAAKCSDMLNAAGSPMTTVYLLTALGVSPSGARKVVQGEVALTPTPPFIFGMYSTSTACPAITFTGTNPSTDSYTTAGGGTYATTKSDTGGDIGSNGAVNVANGDIGGIVGVTSGACPTPVSIKPGGSMDGTVACPSGNVAACYLSAPYSFPVPPTPSPAPPIGLTTLPTCTNTVATTTVDSSGNVTYTYTTTTTNCLVPGTYGDIRSTSNLTLAPGTYNINSLTLTGTGSGITVSPPGVVTLNVAGLDSSGSPLTTAVSIAGNGIINSNSTISEPPNDFIINYGGTGGVKIAGNGAVTAILNAPNAPVTQTGNGAWFGSMLGSTMSIGGNAFFHYDRAAALAPTNNGYYTMVGYREVPY